MNNENEKLTVVKEALKSMRCYLEMHEWPACVAFSSSVLWICGAAVGLKYIDKKYIHSFATQTNTIPFPKSPDKN